MKANLQSMNINVTNLVNENGNNLKNGTNTKVIKDCEIGCFCMKCGRKMNTIHEYHINCRGYGSHFDMMDTMLYVCDEFLLEYGESIITDELRDDELFDVVNSMSIENQELFWNRLDKNLMYKVEPAEWINSVLNETEISHEEKSYIVCANVSDEYLDELLANALDMRY